MSFWETASTAQKLSLIDGGIECLMSSKQVATCLRTSQHKVIYFATEHGRRFPRDPYAMRRRGIEMLKMAAVQNLQRASVRYGSTPVNSSLAKIFPDDGEPLNLFDALPYETEVFV